MENFIFCAVIVFSNDKAIQKNDTMHGRKLQQLISNIHELSINDVSLDPSK